jgi:hypothetical protein
VNYCLSWLQIAILLICLLSSQDYRHEPPAPGSLLHTFNCYFNLICYSFRAVFSATPTKEWASPLSTLFCVHPIIAHSLEMLAPPLSALHSWPPDCGVQKDVDYALCICSHLVSPWEQIILTWFHLLCEMGNFRIASWS